MSNTSSPLQTPVGTPTVELYRNPILISSGWYPAAETPTRHPLIQPALSTITETVPKTDPPSRRQIDETAVAKAVKDDGNEYDDKFYPAETSTLPTAGKRGGRHPPTTGPHRRLKFGDDVGPLPPVSSRDVDGVGHGRHSAAHAVRGNDNPVFDVDNDDEEEIKKKQQELVENLQKTWQKFDGVDDICKTIENENTS